jgi:hypothetical protein
MKLPSVYPLTIPSSQRITSKTAMVSSTVRLLLARVPRAPETVESNGCAGRGDSRRPRFLRNVAAHLAVIATLASGAAAEAQQNDSAATVNRKAAFGKFLAGAAIAFGAHETGHVVFDVIFDAEPGIDKVDFHGIPFFAITHRSDISPKREFAIASAGFWVQHAGSEWLLTKRPQLRRERAPFAKGVLAFNVLASTAYAGAAFAQTGPLERDTRGMAVASGIPEPWIGALVLTPAVMDAWRYYAPDARWPVWVSRSVKIAGVLLILK